MRTETSPPNLRATVTVTSLGPVDVRLEALRLAVVQAPGAEVTKPLAEILAKAKAFETYINTGTVTT